MADTDVPTPFIAPDAAVDEAWIDYNGHMNVAYYVLLFDQGIDFALDHMQIGADYRANEGYSFFTVESHISYIRELTLGDSASISLQIIDYDDKRLHVFQEMRHAGEGFLAATMESLFLHVDMEARKAVPFSAAVGQRIAAAATAHQTLPRPDGIGRSIGIRRKA